ncbi:phosphatidate cytidylyltransferase [Ureaplasma sp. ES3154-GEN]|uniref:phosphatidate cytidylyltransferase n=1 Tax=Ureaplasma sp. ES3154-GEN TaxID=2984844 RepID=UPI0021E88A56|nr:phosphatidate cytidylyltransferase [Ureaplasma sp. ES3154-GEN]MCV3743640.1 phosphatidate cytidylyltransferase [Ureaplasma sp. ES3154-GEN]
MPYQIQQQTLSDIKNKKPKDLKSRFLIGIGIISFFCVFVLFNSLADFNLLTISSLYPLSLITKFVLLAMGILMWMVLLGFVIYEFNKNFFQNNHKTLIINMFIIIISSLASICLLITIRHIGTKFNGFSNELSTYHSKEISKSYWSINAGFLFLVLLINIPMIALNKQLNWQKKLLAIIVLGLIFSFITGTYYLIILRNWVVWTLLLLLVILSDTFAYVGGKVFGKRKIFPKYSPNKTWEGFAIGLSVATVIILGLILVLIWRTNLSRFIPENQMQSEFNLLNNEFLVSFYGVSFFHYLSNTPWLLIFIVSCFFIPLLSILSTYGDLFFSYVKRVFMIKDYSNLLGSHGGFLDRIDAQICTISIYFLVAQIVDII